MNTLLLESDLPEAIRLLHQVEPLGPDAVIVADLGLLRAMRERFPALDAHVSTQAGCASAAAAETFSRLGASRVILERHLHLPEVKRIVSEAPLGVEIFVHGSLCYSHSGKCWFSSFLGGKSGNRGACVQPCRRLYHAGTVEGKEGEALFSTRDLCLIDRIPELSRMGLSALKIEGRMRSAEYVHAVVSAYRAALDLSREGKDAEAVARGRELLAGAVGRAETAGITGGALPGEVAAGGATGNVGELLGEVAEVREGWALVPAPADAIPGDRLRVQFREDGSGKGFTALSLKRSPEGFRVKVPFDLSPGDLLFRVGGGGRAETTRAAVREFSALPTEGLSFRVHAGGGVVAVTASFGKVRREYSYRVAGGAARTREDYIPGDAPHRLRSLLRLDLPLGDVKVEPAGAPVAWGDVESLFVKAARSFDREFHIAGKDAARSVLPNLRVVGNREEEVPTVWFLEGTPAQLHRIPKGEAYYPVTEFTRSLARDPSPVAFGAFRDRGYFRLPAPLFEEETAFLRRTVKEATDRGFSRWIVSDAGHFRLFEELRLRDRVTLVSDHVLYGFNVGALSTLSRLGASRMVLPVEAPLAALAEVGRFLYGLGVAYVYGRIPLMSSRLFPASGFRTGTVKSPREEIFHVETAGKGSVLRPNAPFSASGHLNEMRASGIRDFYADLRGLDGDKEVASVLESLLADRPIAGTEAFNLLRRNF
jgi:putative protease